jgi:carboxylesterase type B
VRRSRVPFVAFSNAPPSPRYAEPPVGSLRWLQAKPKSPWDGVLNGTSFQPACPQHCVLPPAACQAQISEDCLTLNVYAPLAASGEHPVPVLVWFHGGRYQQGSEGVELYDGQMLAALGVLVVTVNYRLGVLGFMAADGVTGNFGVLDQRLALAWVSQNVAAFGGDPAQVTIAGQSAGGTSVAFHLVAAGSFPYFHRAILESSPYGLPIVTRAEAQKHYAHFIAETGCAQGDFVCLRGLPWSAVVAAQTKAQARIFVNLPMSAFFPWTPYVDGVDLTADPLTMVREGHFNRVPLLQGHVSEEAYMFVFGEFSTPLGAVETDALLHAMFRSPGLVAAINHAYPRPENTSDLRAWLSPPASDYIMVCSGRNASDIFVDAGLPVYRYVFDHVWSIPSAWGPNYPFCGTHVCHGSELPFIFNSAALVGYNFTAGEIALSKEMSAYWASFALTGVPVAPGAPVWPRYNPGTMLMQQFRTESTATIADPRAALCDLWDSYGYTQK